MSQLGQTRTSTLVIARSALPPRTDIVSPTSQVRKVPNAEMPTSFDHLVGRRALSAPCDEARRRDCRKAVVLKVT
jgi:hypothetical protein